MYIHWYFRGCRRWRRQTWDQQQRSPSNRTLINKIWISNSTDSRCWDSSQLWHSTTNNFTCEYECVAHVGGFLYQTNTENLRFSHLGQHRDMPPKRSWMNGRIRRINTNIQKRDEAEWRVNFDKCKLIKLMTYVDAIGILRAFWASGLCWLSNETTSDGEKRDKKSLDLRASSYHNRHRDINEMFSRVYSL